MPQVSQSLAATDYKGHTNYQGESFSEFYEYCFIGVMRPPTYIVEGERGALSLAQKNLGTMIMPLSCFQFAKLFQ